MYDYLILGLMFVEFGQNRSYGLVNGVSHENTYCTHIS